MKRANATRRDIRTRLSELVHIRSRLLYQGPSLPSGRAEEFDDDFSFPLTDHSKDSPRSAEEASYTYSFCDIDAITDILGYVWAPEKDVPFCFDPIYFGFMWQFDCMVVSVPVEKREKYLTCITEWEARAKHNLEQITGLYGKLMHVSLVLTCGRAYLIEFEKMMSEISHAAPFACHRPPRRLPADLQWWKERLQQPISCPIPGPAELVDLHAFSDASGGFWHRHMHSRLLARLSTSPRLAWRQRTRHWMGRGSRLRAPRLDHRLTRNCRAPLQGVP